MQWVKYVAGYVVYGKQWPKEEVVLVAGYAVTVTQWVIYMCIGEKVV